MENKQKLQHVNQWRTCRLEKRGRVYVLTLTGKDDHRFNPSSIDDIAAALKTIEQSPDAGALVTTNEGRFFSNGLDLKWIKDNLSSSGLTIIQDKFEGLLCLMMKLGIPTVAAICGHAAAGGFMLALAHDYRFMKDGKEVLYMSELDHGMFMPRSLMAVIKSKIVMANTLIDVVLKAKKFRASEGFDSGFVNGVYEDSAKTLEAAILEAEKLASRNWKRDSYANLRAASFPGVVEELEAHRDPYVWRLGSRM
ncbi:PREDICTED: enoyl-CoA delta isomerase 2, peroxisomal-like [Nelumbo nucifera]|uniref:Delta(3)-Delta(2)-enoyl-CoA isomerase n=2 Tax=Nelumbo nucifera TaxID=4432 RepID=A0A822ZIA4_NELNU|nr:PREDICTED: enoyl-CoA delta isomerase 2, peroxisomal-like [Nelumbo nucifera]DAD43205.1 TPA_asm: hypothetical protein HUJ06_001435 [Nelumbo nucifera]